jgi:hypothetical protein
MASTPELGGVPGQDQEPPLGDVQGDHLHLVAVPEFDVLAADLVPEGPLPLGLEQPAHPPEQRITQMDYFWWFLDGARGVRSLP